jgi:hypothetical protein
MLVAVADTHATDAPPLSDHLRDTLVRAETVVHAGDFTTEAVLEEFAGIAGELVAVRGNSDAAAVRERLPAVATVDALGVRFLVVHGHEHDRTSLSLLARQEGADVALVGHTHRAGVDHVGDLLVVTVGSHADPRGNRPAFVTVGQSGGTVQGAVRTPDGDTIRKFRLGEGRTGSAHS